MNAAVWFVVFFVPMLSGLLWWLFFSPMSEVTKTPFCGVKGCRCAGLYRYGDRFRNLKGDKCWTHFGGELLRDADWHKGGGPGDRDLFGETQNHRYLSGAEVDRIFRRGY